MDIERLRKDLIDEKEAAYFACSFGAALVEALEIEEASDDEVLKLAITNKSDLKKYEL